jgi:hypothetical protein
MRRGPPHGDLPQRLIRQVCASAAPDAFNEDFPLGLSDFAGFFVGFFAMFAPVISPNGADGPGHPTTAARRLERVTSGAAITTKGNFRTSID